MASVVPKQGAPSLNLLGTASEIRSLVEQWREGYGGSSSSIEAGHKLRQILWEPLRKYLNDATTILVSADGSIGRLPIGALPGLKDGSYLIEDHRIALIPVPQLLSELVEIQTLDSSNDEVLLIGAVNYGDAPASDELPSKFKSALDGMPQLASLRDGLVWKALPGAAAEIELIGSLYRRYGSRTAGAVVELRDSEATEAAFRLRSSKASHIHLATHGFFAAPSDDARQASRTNKNANQQVERLMGESFASLRGFNVGQHSGIVFAGANRISKLAQEDATSAGLETLDGIATADEVTFMKLEGVQLVTLSACETGLGEVAGGEGILGLQRSFQLAGARSVISSLWKVDDLGTRLLMERFYTNLLVKKLSKLDALREAQIWMLRNPKELESLGMLDVRSERGGIEPISDKALKAAQDRQKTNRTTPEMSGWTSPRFWAAFQLSGDWR